MFNPKKILVTKFRAMGDTILLTAALKELHRLFPNAEIHAAVTDPWISLLDGMPGVTKLWPVTWHNDRAARTKAATALAFKLRGQKYDLVCGFHASPASAMVALSTGAKTRAIHFHSFKAKNLYSTVQVPGKGMMKPVVERDLDTVRSLGLPVPEGVMPEIFLRETEREFAREELRAWGMTAPVFGIALGASRPTKIWPIHRFAEVALKLVRERNASVLVITGPGEESLVEEFFKSIPSQQEIRDQIQVMKPANVRTLAARISVLDMLIGNDSGPRHLAAALKVPTVTIFGPEHPLEWHPYPQNQHPRLFIEAMPCRNNQEQGSPPWCGLFECIKEEHRCMKEISVDSVIQEVNRILK